MAIIKTKFDRGVEGATNIVDSGTEGTRVATGTTGQRGSTTGQFRFNTTLSLAEYYDGTNFKSIDSPPTISSISPTTQTGANANIVISGSGFSTGATVKFIGSDGTQYSSPSVTVNSATQITATTPSSPLPSSKEPYDIRVTNQSNLFGTIDNALDTGGTPAWTTASGNLGTIADNATGTHFTLAATDPDGTAVTFSESGTNLTNAGLSLSSAGAISGDPNDVSSPTTVSFDVNANSAGDSVLRSFNIIIRKPSITVGSVTTDMDTSGDTYKLSTQGYYLVTANSNLNVYVDLWGAGGGTSTDSSQTPTSGGAGGHAYGQITLLKGTSYVLLIGKGGTHSTTARSFPDGGNMVDANSNRGSGGGSTRFGLYTQSGFNLTNDSTNYNNTNAVYQLIAGGGGGGSLYAGDQGTPGAYGGGTSGAAGGGYYTTDGSSSPGSGGTQSAGGAGGTGGRLANGTAGSKYLGGTGTGTGGGGGYYGGGGSAGYYTMAGGGSGFINSSSGLLSNTGFQTASTYNVAPAGTRSNRLNGTEGNGGTPGSGAVAPDGGVVFTVV
jgi:hypothetical protein